MDIEKIVKAVVKEIGKQNTSEVPGIKIPVGISNHHIHLSCEDFKTLFGKEASLTNIKNLSQPGQFSCRESLTIIGVNGCIEKVRVVGPLRTSTQVEILASDTYRLGINSPVRESGNIEDTPGIILLGPEGIVKLEKGLIIARRHIHMTPADAVKLNLGDGCEVKVKFDGVRGGIFEGVIVRVSDKYRLDFHIDMEEANAFGIKNDGYVTLI